MTRKPYTPPTLTRLDASDPRVTAMAEPPWYADHTRLCALLRYLREQGEEPDAVELLEKPWHWTPEYERMCREQDADVCEYRLYRGIGLNGSIVSDKCTKGAAETVGGKRFCAMHARGAHGVNCALLSGDRCNCHVSRGIP
jgi:hypothetical protein